MSFKKTVSTLVIGGVIGFGVFQTIETYKEVKAHSNFEDTVKNIDDSKVNIQIVADSLKSKINEYAAYPVSYSTATIECFSQYSEGVQYVKNIFTGEILKHPFDKDKDWVFCEPKIWTYASAESKFNHDVNFTTSNVSVEGEDKIILEIDKPYLNTDSIVVDMKTYKELKQREVEGKIYKNYMNNDASILDLKQNANKKEISSIKSNAQRAWQTKYMEVAPEEINKIFETDENKKLELERNTIESVKKLVDSILVETLKSLNIVNEDVELIVKIKQ